MFRYFLLIINCLSIFCSPKYELYTRSNLDQYIIIEKLNNSIFDYSKETKFIIHGFSSNPTPLLKIKTEILKLYDMNVIMVNWKQDAKGPFYPNAAKNTKKIGEHLGNFIRINKIERERSHCIGHSLGAHVCGFAGKTIKLERISGLDPAGPLFEKKPKDSRLDKEDAEFVDIIHTDLELGIQKAIGHLDFYPNGGKNQAGCLFRDLNGNSSDTNEEIQIQMEPKGDLISIFSCSHSRAHLLFAESISKCNFKAIPCANFDDFKKGKCQLVNCIFSFNGCAKMGFHASKYHQNGRHYLRTTKTAPFC
ncbi:unnamed protein product [Brachionus calyciflorus]|uniref:Lipase domain-containing protein n=1 Tax=Brachionus calyciflorus TaxID=104777 RepID=A0A813X2U0_9BILA|nr:unnamed protein product [Brachionus calyciflorus]